MPRIGSFKGPEESHRAQNITPKSEKKPPKYETTATFKIEDNSSIQDAYLKACQKQNPLKKRKIAVYKKGKYPMNEKIQGFATNLPLNRVGK
ncbi:MAG: hypothetical protein WCT85_05865 [Parachlamydiales bacterium]|jgi:hypothetical protein